MANQLTFCRVDLGAEKDFTVITVYPHSLFAKCCRSMLQYLYDHGPIVHTGASVLPPRSLEARVITALIDTGWVAVQTFPTRGRIEKEVISLH